MRVNCPKCRAEVAAANISLEKGWAKCTVCNEVFALADVVEGFRTAAESPPVLERPFDAWARLERADRKLAIVIPPQGMRAGTWALFGFAIFWLGFIAFWTAGALGVFWGNNAAAPINWGNAIFASFSIPFWAVGFGMLGGVVWASRGSLSVYLDASKMYIERRCLIYRRGRFISRDNVQCARPGVTVVQNQNTMPLPSVEIIYENGTFRLPCNSPAEQDWLIAEVNSFLAAVPYSPSDVDLFPGDA